MSCLESVMDGGDGETNHDVYHDNVDSEEDEDEDNLDRPMTPDQLLKICWVEVDVTNTEWEQLQHSVDWRLECRIMLW